MLKKITAFCLKPQFLFCIVLLLVLVVTIQNYTMPVVLNGSPLQERTAYTNYLIFKNSFFHLLHNQDLYVLFPAEHADYYKYSPTFALLMAPLAVLPDFAGLLCWNLLNAWLLFFAFKAFPIGSEKRKFAAFAFVLIEAVTSLENSQSNCIMAALLIFAFLLLEKNKVGAACLLLVLTVFIKLFGIIAFAMLLFYPEKRKAIFYCLLWFVVCTLAPLLVVSPAGLIAQYKYWWSLLGNDHSISYGMSLMGWLNTWFGLNRFKNAIALFGLLIFCIPLIRFSQYKNPRYRMFFLASLLLWIVLFNHKAESPSFVIAVSGVAIWFFTERKRAWDMVLVFLVLVFTALSSTDVFPVSMRDTVLVPYTVKVLPCILVWLRLTAELMIRDFREMPAPNSSSGNDLLTKAA
jgi:hypothetical protein